MYRVFIADDEDTIREGIRDLLESEGGNYAVCGEAADGELALPMIQEMKPDILITDICMPFIDGLKLSSIVKKTMPWAHILILSGYDEFRYAQKAIEIGVDGYVLKPVLWESLRESLEKITQRIERERREILEQLSRRKREEKNRNTILDFFFNEWVNGTIEPSEIYRRAEELGIDVAAQDYVLCYIAAGSEADPEELHALFAGLLEAKKEVHGFRYADAYVLLAMGNSEEKAMENACEAVQMLRHEAERILGAELAADIGPVARRISDVAKAFQKLKKNPGEEAEKEENPLVRILAAEDGTVLPIDFSESVPLAEKLRHAEPADIDQLVESQFIVTKREEQASVLYRYYLLVDLIVTSIRLLKEVDAHEGGQVMQEKMNNEQLLEYAVSYEGTCAYAREFLAEVLRFRDRKTKVPYSEEIRVAKQYIRDHFSDEGLSLHTVAKEVGFSPNHFSTVFSQQMGVTFIEYLINYRVEQSKLLLRDTDLNLNDITFRIGYSEPHYFSYVFKKYTGMTPGAYRRKCRQEAAGEKEGR